MKKTISVIILFLAAQALISAQTPASFTYQAIARMEDGTVLSNKDLTLRIGILQEGVYVWEEDHSVSTSENGFFSLAIGAPSTPNGQGTAGSFSGIDWSSGFTQLEVSVDQGTGFVSMGISDFHAVPYAMYAAESPDEIQNLSLEGNTLSISGGNSVELPAQESDTSWSIQGDTLSTYSHVGIGTSNPGHSALAVQGYNIHPETPLFEVRREDGFPVFAVYNDGVMVYVDDEAKGLKGGFAVGGYSRKSKGVNQEYLSVSSDSVRIYVPETSETKGLKGGFAVGGYSRKSKGPAQDLLFINPDSTRVYVPNVGNEDGVAGLQGGFAVSGYNPGTKGSTDYLMGINRGITRFNTTDGNRGFAIGSQDDGWGSNYLELTPTNSFIGSGTGLNMRDVLIDSEQGWELSVYNVFMGYQSGRENTYGHHNTFLGFRAGTHTLGSDSDPEAGAHNVYIGSQAGFKNTLGAYNVAIGYHAGLSGEQGWNNVFIGVEAGSNVGDVYGVTMLGSGAGSSYQGSGAVTFLGAQAGSSSSGQRNTFVGEWAGSYANDASESIYLGRNAGLYAGGGQNVIIGNEAGKGAYGQSSFTDNTLVGFSSGTSLTSGYYNAFLGVNTGQAATTGSWNAAFGAGAAYSLSTGAGNLFLGAESGYSATTSSYNVIVGHHAGYSLSTTGSNTMLGTYAGNRNVGQGNVFLGFAAGFDETGSNQLYIDNSSTGNPLIWGNFQTDELLVYGDLEVHGDFFQVSDARKKKNIRKLDSSLDKLLSLRGVQYEWFEAEDSQKSIGVLAQEVEDVLPELVKNGRNGEKSVNYSGLIPVLIEALKEQQEQILILEEKISRLEGN